MDLVCYTCWQLWSSSSGANNHRGGDWGQLFCCFETSRCCRPLCNAHTTGTDVLWAGLPMVTLPLEKMATRVAMSLCHAAGCGEEMVVSSMQEYEERAVMLATRPTMLRALTSKLRSGRLSCPLFDTTRWVQNLERAYFKMWNLYCSGSHPQPFKVHEDNVEFPFDQ